MPICKEGQQCWNWTSVSLYLRRLQKLDLHSLKPQLMNYLISLSVASVCSLSFFQRSNHMPKFKVTVRKEYKTCCGLYTGSWFVLKWENIRTNSAYVFAKEVNKQDFMFKLHIVVINKLIIFFPLILSFENQNWFK